jgi:hypothetical protein
MALGLRLVGQINFYFSLAIADKEVKIFGKWTLTQILRFFQGREHYFTYSKRMKVWRHVYAI